MKRNAGIAAFLLLTALCAAGQSTDYWAFGDNRAGMPGPQILSSVYAQNPAAIADAIRNSVSFAAIGLFGPQGASLGVAYTLSIPSFTLAGITESAGGVTQDLLGVQFGLSSRSFAPGLPAEVAAGFSLLRAARATSAGTDSSFRLDLGLSAAFASLRVEALVKNALALDASGFSAFGPSAEYRADVGGKVILDIDCVLGASFSPALAGPSAEGVEMAGTVKFIRYFFDYSLRAGIELTAYADFDRPSNLLPLVEYGLALSYILPDLFPDAKGGTDYFLNILVAALSFLRNLSLDGSVLVIVNNVPDRQGMRVVAGLGMTKFY